MKIIVTILTYQRKANVSLIQQSIKKSTVKPDEIIVLDNSIYNFGCTYRHAVASILDCDYILTLDDDAAIEPKTIENFINWSKEYPTKILGYYGMRLNRTEGQRIYWDGWRIDVRKRDIGIPTMCNVIGNRICWYKPFHARQAIGLLSQIDNYPLKESEDILLSLANNNGFVIPKIKDGGYIALDEMGVGLSRRKEHKDIRDKSVEIILKHKGEI